MKKYVAFVNGVAASSGFKTKEEAESWAAKTLADKPNLEYVTLVEVVGEYHRTTPAIRFEPSSKLSEVA